ncbi:hypothetical protein [Halanaerobium hydrogeniformans]|uniref:Uncharacterized protein n=1 Tax=Halanaerobium hydrogeniformans TaxID=656519 RepID=E4RJ72_HALHG|nr:hypothetical protein [Halanaerobium hydrogeniformans]ADQ15292.1 hypothetical protein Halsa_1874 [Halanaerobium hydrogeniformans]
MERLHREKNLSKTEKEKIIKAMISGYKKMAEVNEDFIKKVSLLEDGAK